MLAEWPDSVADKAINESAALCAEHATNQQFVKLTHEEVKVKIAAAVSLTAVKAGVFRTMVLSEAVIQQIKLLNENRGAKKKPYSWAHLEANGYMGVLLQV